jgi:hypothetical protein
LANVRCCAVTAVPAQEVSKTGEVTPARNAGDVKMNSMASPELPEPNGADLGRGVAGRFDWDAGGGVNETQEQGAALAFAFAFSTRADSAARTRFILEKEAGRLATCDSGCAHERERGDFKHVVLSKDQLQHFGPEQAESPMKFTLADAH